MIVKCMKKIYFLFLTLIYENDSKTQNNNNFKQKLSKNHKKQFQPQKQTAAIICFL